MPVCIPAKDMKDTAAFARTIEEASGPVVVTKNGYDAFAVMWAGDYEAMQLELAKSKFLGRIAHAEYEYAPGNFADGRKFSESLRAKYGL